MIYDGRDTCPYHAYTPRTVAKFLGWLTPSGEPKDKVEDSLLALSLNASKELLSASLLFQERFDFDEGFQPGHTFATKPT